MRTSAISEAFPALMSIKLDVEARPPTMAVFFMNERRLIVKSGMVVPLIE